MNFKNSSMSSVVLRRLATTCRPTSSMYYRRTFATSSPLFVDTNSSNSNTTNTTDGPRTVTLIPGK